MPGDFPTDFTKDDFDKLRADLVALLDAKIDELKKNADNLDEVR